MKKLGKIILGILLILGCSGGVVFDNSGMFVKSAWAAEHTLGGVDANGNNVVVKGNEVTEIACKVLASSSHELKDYEITVKTDSGTFVATYNDVSSGGGKDCLYHIKNIKNNLGSKGFNVSGISCSGNKCNSSGGNGSGSGGGSNGGGGTEYEELGAPRMNILTMCQDKSEGEEAIKCLLNLVVNVLTYGIGVLGVVGIVLSGIQYITSQGDPAKMAKAKNRIIQVVIGLVIYAVMYTALVFLVPGFSPAL